MFIIRVSICIQFNFNGGHIKICFFQKSGKSQNKVGVAEEIRWENDKVLSEISKCKKFERWLGYQQVINDGKKYVPGWMEGWMDA